MDVEQEARKVAVVTGASSGIGLVVARELAAQGWRVIGQGRDPQRSTAAVEEIRKSAAPGATIDMLRANLSLMTEVTRLAGEIAALTDRIDLLVNNAGGTANAQVMTSEGNEATFAVNHLAPFLLTHRLLPLLYRAAGRTPAGSTRIINVSSSAHEYSPGLNWQDLQSFENFVPIVAYCNAKLANVLFTRTVAARLAGSGIVAYVVHPGAVDTRFFSYADEGTQEFGRTQKLLSSEEGADTVLWLATSPVPAPGNGRYFHQRREIPASAAGQNDDDAERLWSVTRELVEKYGM
jgi:NAD(P)-dependent dehydrogenase (short-subunit alcohol dehydrogenase family)